MSEATAGTSKTSKPRLDLGARLRRNPVVVKELRARMRGNRAFALLTTYLGLLGLLVSLAYLLFLYSNSQVGPANERQMIGKAIFGIVVGMELLAVSFIAPGLTAGAIASERERQTYDLLRTTLLPARSLVLGKFFSALVFLLLLLFTALPLQSLAFLFGGVGIEEVLIASLILVVSAIAFCAAGMFFSSFLARTLTSTVLSYAFTILLIYGLPFLFLVFSGMLGLAFSNLSSQLSVTGEVMLIIGGWILLSLNPLATALATEIILLEQQSVLSVTLPLSRGVTVSLPSPWIPHTLIYLLVSLLLIWLSVRFVKRVER